MVAVTLSKGGYTVIIDAVKIEEQLQNPVIKVALPIPRQEQDKTPPKQLAFDLKRVDHVITIHGYLRGQSGLTAYQAKQLLITKILNPSGPILLKWRNSSDYDYGGTNTAGINTTFERVLFSESSLAAEPNSTEASPAFYDISLNLVRADLK